MKKKPAKKPAAKKSMNSVNPFANAKKGQNPFANKGQNPFAKKGGY